MFENLLKEIKDKAKRVDEFILKNLEGEIKDLYEASKHLVKAGGKRLRPFLVLTSYELFRSDSEKVIPVAAAVEIFHTFTLIHDDIMDQDEFRRGVPTVHTVWGVPMAILAGDLLHAKAYELIAKSELSAPIIKQLLAEFTETAVVLCEGQALDMSFETRVDVSIEEYFDMIRRKTAWLFRLSCRFGAISAGAGEEYVKALTKYGEKIGIAFQMVDDWLGLFGSEEKTGKPVGSDVRESKKTYPILYALEHASEEDKKRLLEILSKKEKTEEDVKEALDIIKRTGADKATKEMAKKYIEEALRAIEILPESTAKKNLISLAKFTLERGF
ncbi:MAG: polyprenyl synthetase family protein [Candidatus Njordarchaeales archaeon]